MRRFSSGYFSPGRLLLKHSSFSRLLICSGISLLSLSACQVVSVKQQTIAVSLTDERDSILTRARLSEATLNVLSMTGQDPEQCLNEPYACLKQLKNVAEVRDEQYLSAGSELFVAKLDQLKQNETCKSPLAPVAHRADSMKRSDACTDLPTRQSLPAPHMAP